MIIRPAIQTETEIVYVAGTSLENALERRADRRYYGDVAKDTPREAYDAIGYFELLDSAEPFDVYEIKTIREVKKIEPPYKG